MKLRFALLLSLLAARPLLAETRPLLTEEATTAPSGTIVLETGGDWIHAEPNYLTGRLRDRYDAPLLRLVASPADNVELDVEWVGRVGVQRDPDFGSVSDWGDVSLRAKVRFRDLAPGKPAFGARFAVTLPETSFGNGLGPNTMRVSAQLLMTAPLGGAARLHVNAGFALQDEVLRPHEQRDFTAFGVALEAPVGKRVTALAEIAGRAGKGMPGADERIEARGGVRVPLGRVTLDAAIRRGLSDAVGKWGFTAGVRIPLKR